MFETVERKQSHVIPTDYSNWPMALFFVLVLCTMPGEHILTINFVAEKPDNLELSL